MRNSCCRELSKKVFPVFNIFLFACGGIFLILFIAKFDESVERESFSSFFSETIPKIFLHVASTKVWGSIKHHRRHSRLTSDSVSDFIRPSYSSFQVSMLSRLKLIDQLEPEQVKVNTTCEKWEWRGKKIIFNSFTCCVLLLDQTD